MPGQGPGRQAIRVVLGKDLLRPLQPVCPSEQISGDQELQEQRILTVGVLVGGIFPSLQVVSRVKPAVRNSGVAVTVFTAS